MLPPLSTKRSGEILSPLPTPPHAHTRLIALYVAHLPAPWSDIESTISTYCFREPHHGCRFNANYQPAVARQGSKPGPRAGHAETGTYRRGWRGQFKAVRRRLGGSRGIEAF